MQSIKGTWLLQSLIMENENKTIEPFGRNVKGVLIYTEDGYMTGIISATERPNVSSPAMMGLSDEERIAISKNFNAYAGRYKVEADKIIHYVESSFVPNLMTLQEHVLSFNVEDNKLVTVSIPAIKELQSNQIILTWERAGNSVC